MYLFCYARSAKGRETGTRLLNQAEGEWITSFDNFIAGEAAPRADGAILLILPVEASVRLLIEKLYPADVKYPIISMAADGSSAMLLKHRGYNTYELFEKLCKVIGCKALSTPADKAELAADLMKPVNEYKMTANNPELLKEIAEYIKEGGNVAIYSDLPIVMSEPILDSLSYSPFTFRTNQHKELGQAYAAACEADEYTIFITNTYLPEVQGKGKCLKLVPRNIAVGVEFTGRTDPEYASKIIKDTLINHEIDPNSVYTVAVSAMAKESDAVVKIADDLGCYVTSFDMRVLGAVKLPLKASYTPERQSAETCTAAACLAADNNISTLIRKAGGNSGILMTAVAKKGNISIT